MPRRRVAGMSNITTTVTNNTEMMAHWDGQPEDHYQGLSRRGRDGHSNHLMTTYCSQNAWGRALSMTVVVVFHPSWIVRVFNNK
jgi:hypothetical protein